MQHGNIIITQSVDIWKMTAGHEAPSADKS